MRDKAREFFEEAKLLCAAKKFNGAASRLYYSLYHAITAVFEEKGIKQSNLTSKVNPAQPHYWLHEVVRNNFTLAGIPRYEKETVKAAWRLRGISDYEEHSVEEVEIRSLLPKVETVLTNIGVLI